MKGSRLGIALMWGMLAVIAANADTIGFSFTTINAPGAATGATGGTFARAINDAGQIVGSYGIGNSAIGFLDTNGVFSSLVAPTGVVVPDIHGINDSGQMVGFFQGSFANEAFVYSNGTAVPIPIAGAVGSIANGINGEGEIVGIYSTSQVIVGNNVSRATYGFLSVGNSISVVSAPGAVETDLMAINGAGQIVGSFSTDITDYQGFLDVGNAFTPLEVPGAGETFPYGINDRGQIVGTYVQCPSCQNTARGFIYSGGTFSTINVPGAVYTEASGINNHGQIVGGYVDSSGMSHGFLATPVPEAPALELEALGLILLFITGTFRNRASHRATIRDKK